MITAETFEKLSAGKVDPKLLDWINDELNLIEDDLTAQTASAVSLITSIGSHTLKSGGKRLRPAFVLVAAHATNLPFDAARARHCGCVMEMIHMASLIHDDVIDGSLTRRGQATAHSLFGTTESVLSGDVLLARSMALMAEDGDLAVTRIVSEAVVEVAEGEIRELGARGDFDIKEEDHLEILRLKTASFIRACCAVGAHIANAPAAMIEGLKSYGNHVGLAFQIADDLLDYRGKGLETGKPRAIDFRDGQMTLPLIRLISKISEEERLVLRSRFGNGISDDEIAMVSGWMDSRGAFTEVEEMANNEVRLAIEALHPLPDNPFKDLLKVVAEYVVRRTS